MLFSFVKDTLIGIVSRFIDHVDRYLLVIYIMPCIARRHLLVMNLPSENFLARSYITQLSIARVPLGTLETVRFAGFPNIP